MIAVRTFKDQPAVAADVIEMSVQMATIAGTAGDLDHHFGGAPDDTCELRVGGGITRAPRRTQYRASDAGPTYVDRRAQRLLKPEGSTEVGHGSADQ
ncbi:hypothetical protein CD943_00405 [Brevundimonas diminuta]|uniref:Uncharacterized protein n=1 Tax=Brevundimonas diminuta TaxID=293 RepID=A0A1Z3LTE9_BREDI|nr:hypothetical protein CD943_00405 [Brevundimonas diminuta]